jgi:hypothetical protein
LRWDKPPREADRLETLEKMLSRIESGRGEPPGAGAPGIAARGDAAEIVLDSAGSGDSHG